MEGIVRIPRELPTDQQSMEQFLRRLNAAVKTDGQRAVLAALTTISERTGTDIGTLLTYLGDNGRAIDQRLLPVVNFGNVSSVQSAYPLSATAGDTTADITIAAHTLHTDFGAINYNSGSVTGLVLNTSHYVYTDDPNYQGGAVTYVATTARPNVPASSGRYLVGVITTPVSANSANITGATSANPIVFTTSAAHGWSSGDNDQFAALPGDFGTHLNGTTKTITVVSPTTFSIAVDGTTYAAYTSGGIATRVVADSTPDFGGGGGGYLP